MPIADDQPATKPLTTCSQVERYPDVISFWLQSPGSNNIYIKDVPRYDFLGWIRPLVADKSSDSND
jgi:hypothetical protein